jgi:hypothetical protein
MATGATGQLGLALPVQGELSGTWGDTVNNGITQYTNIAIAATLTLTGDGAVTLANTTGDATASNITSTLTGAGTVTAQFAVVQIAGTLTTTKIVTGPSYSKTYVVDNAATGGAVTFKAAGQTGVSVAVGEKCTVYYNGTDYVKVASSTADGVTTFQTSLSGLTPATATAGAVTLAGVLGVSSGGTNLSAGTSGGVLAYTATGTLASSAALTQYGVVYGGGAGAVPVSTAAGLTGQVLSATTGGAPTWTTPAAQAYPGAGIANSTGSAWGTSYSTTGSGTVVALATSPSFTTPVLGTPTSGNLSNCTADGTNPVGFLNIPQNVQTGSYTLTLGDAGEHIYRGSGSAATWTIPAASSVAFPLGTAITFINLSATSVSIDITTDTMYLSSAGTTGTRTLAQYGSATAIKVSGVSSSGIWVISGSGLT